MTNKTLSAIDQWDFLYIFKFIHDAWQNINLNYEKYQVAALLVSLISALVSLLRNNPTRGNINKNNTRARIAFREVGRAFIIIINRYCTLHWSYETGSTCVSLCKVAQSTFLSPWNRRENSKPRNDYVITYLRTTNKWLYVARGYFFSISSWVIHADVCDQPP